MKTMNADEVANIQDEQEDIKANFEEVMQAMGSGGALVTSLGMNLTMLTGRAQ